jgi:hypothetical protein
MTEVPGSSREVVPSSSALRVSMILAATSPSWSRRLIVSLRSGLGLAAACRAFRSLNRCGCRGGTGKRLAKASTRRLMCRCAHATWSAMLPIARCSPSGINPSQSSSLTPLRSSMRPAFSARSRRASSSAATRGPVRAGSEFIRSSLRLAVNVQRVADDRSALKSFFVSCRTVAKAVENRQKANRLWW